MANLKRKVTEEWHKTGQQKIFSYVRWQSAGDSHHEQDKRKHQPRVRGITERFAEPGWEIRLQRLLDHVKHPVLAAMEKEWKRINIEHRHLKLVSLPEGSAIKWRWNGNDGVDGWQSGEEEDDQKHGHIEIIRAWGFEDPLLWDVAAHHSPALQIHGDMEPQDIHGRQAGGIEGTHPEGKGNLSSLILVFTGCTKKAYK